MALPRSGEVDAAGIEKLCLCGITGRPPKRAIAKTALGAEESVPWEHTWEPVALLRSMRERGCEIACKENNIAAAGRWNPVHLDAQNTTGRLHDQDVTRIGVCAGLTSRHGCASQPGPTRRCVTGRFARFRRYRSGATTAVPCRSRTPPGAQPCPQGPPPRCSWPHTALGRLRICPPWRGLSRTARRRRDGPSRHRCPR